MLVLLSLWPLLRLDEIVADRVLLLLSRLLLLLLWACIFCYYDRPYCDATAERMDLEARKMVDSAYQRTLKLVQDKKEQVGHKSLVTTYVLDYS